MSLRADLAEHFLDVAGDDKLLSECATLCQTYNLTAEELFYQWEALNFSSTTRSALPSAFSADSVVALKAVLHTEAEKKRARQQPQHNNRAKLLDIRRPKTEAGLRFTKPVTAGSSSARSLPAGIPRVNFKGPNDTPNDRKKRRYRYMHEKISERSEVLDEHIDEFGEIVKKHYNLDDLGDPSAASEEDIVVVGRICHEADSSTNSSFKLSEDSIFLESSRLMGSGARVPLRFDSQVKMRGGMQGMGGLGMFPGAIVALKGKNGGGGWFSVNEILGLPPLTIAPSSLATEAGIKSEQGSGAFSMCMACGPYTAEWDLEFKPFASLLERMSFLKPAVLLFLGPFIDTAHPLIKSGDIDHSPTEIFFNSFLDRLRDFLAVSPESLILVVPSIGDVISDHAVFPQCELGPEFSVDPRIRLLPNPCRFTVNNISFAACSVDVLFHLKNQQYVRRAEEIDAAPCADAPGNDPMANICRYLLQQRSFYPIYPVPVELSQDVNLDVTHAEGLRLDSDGDHAPDVLLFSSKFKHFSKLVDSTLMISPSFLWKGTYAVLDVAEDHGGAVKGRLRCEVAKL